MKHTFLHYSLALVLFVLLNIPYQSVFATNPFTEQFQFTSNLATTDTLGALGFAVDLDGDYAITGSYLGGAAIFKKDPNQQGQWLFVKHLQHHVSYGGASVLIKGDYAFIGSPFEEISGVQVGKVYVYHKNAGGTDNWGQVQVLTPGSLNVSTPGRYVFGFSMDLSGDLFIVGATGTGTAFIFEHNQTNNNWVELKEIQTADASWQQSFGYTVAIDGDIAMVGAYFEGEDENGNNPIQKAGAVFVFERNTGGADNWGQSQKLVASDRNAWDQFGWNIDIDRDFAAIGAPVKNAGSGSTYLFKKNQFGQWNELKQLSAGTSHPMRFGYKVQFSQDQLLISAPLNQYDEFEADSMLSSGAIYLFHKNEGGAENWGQLQKIVASNRDPHDYFGFGIALDGTDMIVGASHRGYEPGTIANHQFGMVYYFSSALSTTTTSTNPIGEVGRVQTALNWTTVQLQNAYTNPIVVAGPASSNQAYLAVVRVRNVTATSFEIRLDDWDCNYSQHGPETINYMVMEEGTHVLPNGNRVTAGKLTGINDRYTTHVYANSFNSSPVLLAQCVSENFAGPLVSRIDHRNTNMNQFRIRLQNPQNQGNVTTTEEVHWIGMQRGMDASGLAFEANVTGRNVKHKWYRVNFAQTYSNNSPIFLSMMNSSYGNDPAGMRYKNLSASNVQVKIEEENCGDSETKHTRENVGYVVFDDAGSIMPFVPLTTQGPQLFNFLNPEEEETEENIINIKTFPNPATQFINIEISGIEENATNEVKIFDLNGKLHRRMTFSGLKQQIELGDLKNGLYLIQIRAGSEVRTVIKVMKLE